MRLLALSRRRGRFWSLRSKERGGRRREKKRTGKMKRKNLYFVTVFNFQYLYFINNIKKINNYFELILKVK